MIAKVKPHNLIPRKAPELLAQWDFQKNGLIQPENVSALSIDSYYWICDQGHSLKSPPRERIKTGCTECNRLERKRRRAMEFWDKHPQLEVQLLLGRSAEKKLKVTSSNSRETFSWQCPSCGDIYSSTVRAQFRRKSLDAQCKRCDQRERTREQSQLFWASNPELKSQLLHRRNSKEVLNEVTAGSSDKLWWKCPTCGGDWLCAVHQLTRSDVRKTVECSECAIKRRGRRHTQTRLKGGNNLSQKFPEIAKEWATDLNELGPDQVTPSNNNKFFWRCELGHVWQDKVGNRTNLTRGCPECRDFSTSLLELRLVCELTWTNGRYAVLRAQVCGVEADIYIPCLRLIIECDGYPWHDDTDKRKRDLAKNRLWRKSNYEVIRVRDQKLKPMVGHFVNFYEKGTTNHKEIVIDVLSKISEMHPYSTVVKDLLRFHESNDGFRAAEKYDERSRQRLSRSGDSLVDHYPEISAEWDFKANEPLTPDRVSRGSELKVGWICADCNHKWSARISNRTSLGRGCPECAKERVQTKRMRRFLSDGNNLAEHFPDVARDWDQKKNGDKRPEQIAPHSNYKAHWVCHECGHRWSAYVANRTKKGGGSGCPKCWQRRQRQERA